MPEPTLSDPVPRAEDLSRRAIEKIIGHNYRQMFGMMGSSKSKVEA